MAVSPARKSIPPAGEKFSPRRRAPAAIKPLNLPLPGEGYFASSGASSKGEENHPLLWPPFRCHRERPTRHIGSSHSAGSLQKSRSSRRKTQHQRRRSQRNHGPLAPESRPHRLRPILKPPRGHLFTQLAARPQPAQHPHRFPHRTRPQTRRTRRRRQGRKIARRTRRPRGHAPGHRRRPSRLRRRPTSQRKPQTRPIKSREPQRRRRRQRSPPPKR